MYHLKNYGNRGGCNRPRRITPSSISIILQMILSSKSLKLKYTTVQLSVKKNLKMLHRLVLQRDQKRDQAKSTCLKKYFLKFSKFFKQTKLIQDLYCNWLLQTDEPVIVSPRPTQARSRLLGAFNSHISSSSQPFSLKIYL